MAEEEVIVVDETAGPVPDQGLYGQIVRGYQFPAEWDAQYPQQGQTATDAPPIYITLFADFFIDGNFRLPATHFMAAILYYYGFHISQLSPTGIVRNRHIEFICRSQGLEPSVEKFRVFYQLIRNMGFYSFALHSVKKILINPQKSFHDWTMKFFFIRVKDINILSFNTFLLLFIFFNSLFFFFARYGLLIARYGPFLWTPAMGLDCF
ncbi:hypothetical protein Hanom_Chr05g00417391 [Helianthus anomalus]